MDFREWVRYSEYSPTGLFRLGPRGELVAGCFKSNKDGTPKCVDVSIKNKRYKAHTIIWLLHGNTIKDGFVIDHLDGNPFNNKIENLQSKPKKLNHRNNKMCKRNKTGVNGVCRVGKTNMEYYKVTWYNLQGRTCSKHFSIKRYGEAEAFRLACEHRRKVISELNTEGAGYTDRHGT